MRKAIVVAGPTASGKTKYAINLSQILDGIIINFDSIQIYNDLKILTAFPSEQDMKSVPHKLFGYMNAMKKTNATDWAKLAAEEIEKALEIGKKPILVGGTGFYINTLINGINDLPKISKSTREMTEILANENYENLCKIVYKNDQRLEKIITRDKHRQMLRAYEILQETGSSILEFYLKNKRNFIKNIDFEFHLLDIPRCELYKRINLRFENMLKNGAIEEVRQLLQKCENNSYDFIKNLPIFGAIGAKEIVLFLNNKCSFEEMICIASQKSRHYAKRQMTWFRNKIPENFKLKLINI
ncbi:tRNA dimethylallyltransferase [Alphaproteobacteria bacterium]|nr:tRNA dimethylallyltransferase [Alphaproteobacteria bacterium]